MRKETRFKVYLSIVLLALSVGWLEILGSYAFRDFQFRQVSKHFKTKR